MNVTAKHISDYIDYLKNSGLTITLHGKMIYDSTFIKYNFHQNPYCHYIKTVYGLWNECICRQYKVTEKCENGSFFGCCYAGVGEYIYPIKIKEKQIGFISVSGYINDLTIEKAKHFALKQNIPYDKLIELAKRHLNKRIPTKEFTDSVIMPLVFMLQDYFERLQVTEKEVALYNKMLHYIALNSHKKITMSDLSNELNYSVSTLSHLFFKNSGKSLPQYIDDLRLEEATWHLLHSYSSISEISCFLGYSSSNYFSTAFKRKYGITPSQYRTNK